MHQQANSETQLTEGTDLRKDSRGQPDVEHNEFHQTGPGLEHDNLAENNAHPLQLISEPIALASRAENPTNRAAMLHAPNLAMNATLQIAAVYPQVIPEQHYQTVFIMHRLSTHHY
jgi:hypothetical protein